MIVRPVLGKLFAIHIPAASISTFQELHPSLAGITDPAFTRDFERRLYVRLRGASDVDIGVMDPTDPLFQFITIPAGEWFELYTTSPIWIRSAGDVDVLVGY